MTVTATTAPAMDYSLIDDPVILALMTEADATVEQADRRFAEVGDQIAATKKAIALFSVDVTLMTAP